MEADKQMTKKMIEKYCVNCRGYFFDVFCSVKKFFCNDIYCRKSSLNFNKQNNNLKKQEKK